MKRVLPYLLAVLLLLLGACQPAPNAPSQAVSEPSSPSPSESPSAVVLAPSPSPGEDADSTPEAETSLVASCSLDYTTDLTTQFPLNNLMFLYDLNGDGVYEIYFQHRGWEGGHCAVFTRTDSGWTEVLRANYGT